MERGGGWNGGEGVLGVGSVEGRSLTYLLDFYDLWAPKLLVSKFCMVG